MWARGFLSFSRPQENLLAFASGWVVICNPACMLITISHTKCQFLILYQGVNIHNKKYSKWIWAMPVWHNMPINFSEEKPILVGFIPMASSLSFLHDILTKWYDLELWPLTLRNKWIFPLIQVNKCTKLYDPEVLRFRFHLAYKALILSIATTLTFDLLPWQIISYFLSSWWSSVTCYELTIWSVSCL
jgi:hypothetical protein